MKKSLLIFLLFIFIAVQVPAENFYYGLTPLSDDPSISDPYEKEEFPEWAWKVRRFEVIFFGGLPVVYMFTTLGYDIYQKTANGENFGSQRDQRDLLNMVLISISVSGAIAIADLIISLIKDHKKKNAGIEDLGFSRFR